MAQQSIGIGAFANDGSGDTLRTAFIKVNANLDELYSSVDATSFDSIAEAIAHGPDALISAYSIKGYASPGDGGGGNFYFDPFSADQTNSGTVFAMPAGATPGRLKRIYGDTINPLWFGALPGGAVDCRNAFQAAFLVAQNKTLIIPQFDFRIVATKPIFIGTANIRGLGGKLWISLPDGYTNPNTAVTETYSAPNVLDENGVLVTWNYPGAPTYPWNGKTEVFYGASGSKIENLWIDFGWGTTDAPAGVRPITGIGNNLDEFTYYQSFNNSINTSFVNCFMRNTPGAFIEVGHDLLVTGCTFEEFGDHVFYIGQDVGGTGSQKNFRFAGNKIICSRAQVGTLGQAAFVFSSFRQALKFRGCGNTIITGNDFNDANDLITAMYMEVNSGQPGNVDRVTITGNHFKGFMFFECIGYRTDGGFGATDYRFKKIQIKNNNVEATNTHVRIRCACDGITISNNDFTGTATVLSLAGYPRWTSPIKSLTFSNNRCETSATSTIWLSGKIRDIFITKNTFLNTGAPASSSSHVILVDNPFDIDQGFIDVELLESCFTRLVMDHNICDNYFSWFYDGNYVPYDAAHTYQFGTFNGIDEYSVVSFSGALYRNTVTTLGSAPNVAHWTPFVRGDATLILRDNIRACSSASASPNNSTYLTYLVGTAALLRMNYNIIHSGNLNFNTLGEAVTYFFGVVGEIEMDASSRFKLLQATTLQSGGNSGSINNFDTINILNDLKILAGGSADQVQFYPGQPGPQYVDIGGLGSTGLKQLRLIDGSTINFAAKNDGTVTAATSVTCPLFVGSLSGPITGSISASLSSLPAYATNAAAITGGLGVGKLYRTGADPDLVCIVH